jgi:hypothetical protein
MDESKLIAVELFSGVSREQLRRLSRVTVR